MIAALLLWAQASTAQSEQQWTAQLKGRAIPAAVGDRYAEPSAGLALYFLHGDTTAMPYLVYVPRRYDPAKASGVVIFLHGAILARPQYQYSKIEIADEPIFAAATDWDVLVVFPFAKSDYKWSGKSGAYEDVVSILKEVEQHYRTNEKQVYIGGISMGGIATFWYVNHHPELFKGFYTFSAMPALQDEEIKWGNITRERRMFSVHAKDDMVFPCADVERIYKQHRAEAPGWYFGTVESGGHRFIYSGKGPRYVQTELELFLTDRR